MPGVSTGDMGPKLGYNGKDNGWLTFDKVRVPRD
jgi:acyl-CoA oxidase